MRTTVDDVYRAAEHIVRMSGARLGKVLSDLARRGISTAPLAAKPKGQRFPTFRVPADARMIPAFRLEQYLDEED